MDKIKESGTENAQYSKEIEHLKQMLKELEETNKHLIAATFREREMRKQLNDAIEELECSQKIIEDQNKRISESINYSRNIQEAINPDEQVLLSYFPDSCIMYIPKDVISGDFPWLYKKDHYVYVAAVDCTGHGVPGAMMSIIGTLLLNSIVGDNALLSPGEILDILHTRVVKTLKQDSSAVNSSDGMDVALVRIDTKNKEIEYAGAHRPLLYFSKAEGVIEIKGDRFPIGGMHYERKRVAFKNTTMKYELGDFMFMFSDGLCDQVGGPEMKKLSMSRFVEFATSKKHLRMQKFESECIEYLDEWMVNARQVDDILLLGVRF